MIAGEVRGARALGLAAAAVVLAAAVFLADHIAGGVEDAMIRSGVPTQFIQDPVSALSLKCLTPQAVETVRASKSIDAAFRSCEGELSRALGPEFAHLERPDLRAVFAMLAAHNLAPYGASRAIEFDALLREPALACDNYMLLTAYLAGDGMSLVGYQRGVLGSHAQIFYSRGSVHLLLDPTVALVALADFDSVMAGQPVPARSIRHFYAGSGLTTFLSVVIHGLLNGRHRRSDLIYVYDSLDHYRKGAGLPPAPARGPGRKGNP